MVEQFTRWIELQALGVQDAVTVAPAFFKSYTIRFRVLIVIHTDQGKNFDGNFFMQCVLQTTGECEYSVSPYSQ